VPHFRKSLVQTRTNLAVICRRLDRLSEAEAAYKEVLVAAEDLAHKHPFVPDYQYDLAGAHNNLGLVYRDTNRLADAEKSYREALKILQRLAQAQPRNPQYRYDAAGIALNLGMVLVQENQFPAADKALQEALDGNRALVEQFPQEPLYGLGLAQAEVGQARLCVRQEKLTEAVDWYGKGLRRLAPLHERNPRNALVRLNLQATAMERAGALMNLKRFADAVPDWDQAIQLDPGEDRPMLRLSRAFCLAHSGDHVQASAEVHAVAEAAGKDGLLVYRAAALLAVVSGMAARDPKLDKAGQARKGEEYAAAAVALLEKARQAGAFRDAQLRDNLARDPDLASLRQRDDFRQLLQKLPERP
jgi:tetratricopeptide (TPR) repeat protein